MIETPKPSRLPPKDRSKERSGYFRKYHYLIALFVACAALAVYMTSLVRGAVPGESANILTYLSGIHPNMMMRHVVWRKIIGAAIWAGGSKFVFFVNVVCAIFSALGVGMMYLVTSALVNLMIDREHLNISVSGGGRQKADVLCVLGGVFAAAALAFSPPYWFAATQCFYHSFYLFWLLGAIFLLFRFADTLNVRTLYVCCFLYGAGLAQTSSFVAFFPLVYLFAIFVLWQGNKLTGKVFGMIVLLTVIGGSLIVVNAFEFYGSTGYGLLKTGGFFPLLRQLVAGITRGVFGSLPRVGWMIVLGLTIVPCLAILLTGFRALNGETDWSFYALNIAVLIVTLVVVFDLRVSPWQFFNMSYPQVVPYAMMSLTFGYLAAYFYSLALYFIPSEIDGNPNRVSVTVRYGIVLLVSAISTYAFFNNRAEADHKQMGFVWVYADTLLDHLDGRKWLVTNGVLDDVVLVRAKERGIDVNLLNLAHANNRIAMTIMKSKLKNVRLQNSADVGIFPLIQEWVSNDPEASSELGLCLFPDLWNVGDYEVYPYGLAFFGAAPQEMKALRKEDFRTPYFEMLDRFIAVLDAVPDTVQARGAFYKQLVKGQISFVGNNLGYFLETNGRREEAFEVYQRVHEFDPRNVSALLNFASMVQGGMHPELKDTVMNKLEAFQRSLTAPIEIWSLSRTFGYVSSPEAFARLGWTWAMTGQANLALNSLTRALEDSRPENRSKLRTVIADVYLQSNDLLASERVYKEILAEDPGDHRALIGLVRINIINGDAKQAAEYLAQAKTAGVPLERLLYETVARNLMLGDIDEAQIVANELVARAPDNPEAHTILSVIYSERYLAAKTPEASDEALKGMEKAADELERISGENDFQTLFVKGRINMITRNYAESRKYFIQALRNAKTPHVVPLLDSILRMDHALSDKKSALKHAREILHRAPGHSFANYIMGSLAIEKEDYTSAEDYLTRSLQSEALSVFVLNDLAVTKLKLGKIDEAEKLIRKSFKTDDQVYASWDTLGSIFLAKGDIGKALEAFETALKLHDKDLRVHLHLAQIYFKKGEVDKSREIIRKLGAGSDVFTGDDLKEFEALVQGLLMKSR